MRFSSPVTSPRGRHQTRRRARPLWRRSPHHPASWVETTVSEVHPKRRWRSPSSVQHSQARPWPQGRLFLVWGILVGAAMGLGWRTYQLQHVETARLKQTAQAQQLTSVSPFIPRRAIIDRQGLLLATDRLTYTLYAHPRLFKRSPQDIATVLTPILRSHTPTSLTTDDLIERFQQQKTGLKLATRLSESVAREIRSLGADGLDLEQHYTRFYPQNEATAEVLGFVNLDHIGQAGVEQSQRRQLQRTGHQYRVRQTGQGHLLPDSVPTELLKSEHLQLQLTLDLRLQRAAREALGQHMGKYRAKRGTVIIMDVRDGSLLALACEPTYNPNQYWQYNVARFKNWAVADLYEPGSTFKPINVAIALEAGAIHPNAYVYDSGKIAIDGWDILNHDYHSRGGRGALSLAQVLQYSSNVGMIRIMQRLKRDDYYAALRNLGLGEKVGTDLPGDAASHLKSKAEFTIRRIEAATAAFGQGLSLTPLKLVQLHGAIANGGELVTPHVVQGLTDPDGKFHWQPSLTSKRVFSSDTSRQVLSMMESVVDEGSGKPAKIKGYRIGGKTGTAQKAAGRGYSSHAKITSFVAMLPIESPRYVVAAVIDEPRGDNTFGSTVAAPIVKQVMEALISVEGLPPAHQNPVP